MHDILNGKPYRLVQEDCIIHMASLPDACFDFSIFSPPFPSMYAYTEQQCDIGNSEDFSGDAKLHLSFFFRQFARLVKPGRVICVHCMDIPRLKRSGGTGLFDFHGFLIRLGERAGLIHDFTWGIPKNPQAQAIRTRSRELQFSGLESDRAKSRGALPDYVIKFIVPGENKIPIRSIPGDDVSVVTRDEWIKWAESYWIGIRETDTLNTKNAKGKNDTKHICPLQLEVIRRYVRLFSNPNEIVFSPFAGIGSEGFVSLENRRRFYGCEIKTEYVKEALENLEKSCKKSEVQPMMF